VFRPSIFAYLVALFSLADIPFCKVSSFFLFSFLVCNYVAGFCMIRVLFCLLCECHYLSCILCTCKNVLNQHDSFAAAAGPKSCCVSVSYKYKYDTYKIKVLAKLVVTVASEVN
jgi:hypothetical protein